MFFFSAASEDYEEVINEPVMFLDGSGPGQPSCFSLQIINDSILELNEMFDVVLTSNDAAVMVVDPNQAEVTIIDNDSEFQVYMCLLDYDIVCGGGWWLVGGVGGLHYDKSLRPKIMTLCAVGGGWWGV